MRRTKTMLMGDLLEEFFKRPYVAAKVAEGKLPDTWREIVGDRAAEITTEQPPFGRPAGQRRDHPIKKCPSPRRGIFRMRPVRTYFTITARLAFWLLL